jgi:hypothetical protein
LWLLLLLIVGFVSFDVSEGRRRTDQSKLGVMGRRDSSTPALRTFSTRWEWRWRRQDGLLWNNATTHCTLQHTTNHILRLTSKETLSWNRSHLH